MIEIKPPNPVEGDNIAATISGNAGPCFIIPNSPPSQLIDNNPVFTLRLDCTGIGGFIPAPYSREFQLGTLTSGSYTAIHEIVRNGSSIFSEQIAFKVTAVKDVPVADPLGLIILSTLLLIMGKKLFKQRS